MRNQEWLEQVVKIRNQLEVVKRHESNELAVFNESPKRKESHIPEEKDEKLEHNDGYHHIVESNCSVSHVSHLLIYSK